MTIQQAYDAGREAFKAGRMAAPALNQTFIAAACSSAVKTVILLDAYNKGWHTENLVA